MRGRCNVKILMPTLLGLIFAILFVTHLDIHKVSSHDGGHFKSIGIHRQGRCINSILNSNSKWFQNRNDISISPFWTRDNIEISPESTRWWLKLQKSDEANMTKIMHKLYNAGVPSHFREFPAKKDDPCITCAVVGNSAILKHSKYGEEIDSHSIVIRFNKAVTEGFQEDVGRRTTHRILYPESAVNTGANTSLVLVPFKPLDVEWLLSAITTGHIAKTYMPVLREVHCDISKINILHPDFLRYIHKNWLDKRGRYPSTGIIGVSMALQMCDSVNVYGFGADKDGGWQHYWEHLQPSYSLGFRKTGVHDGDVEKRLLDKLHSQGVITLHKSHSSSSPTKDRKIS